MQIKAHKRLSSNGFTLAEVCVAVAICAIFATAVFSTNQRLLTALRSQRESTAAMMMLQERMETFRGFTYSNIGDKDYVKNNVVKNPTTSEDPLGQLSETITVTGYSPEATPSLSSSDYTQWVRSPQHSNGQEIKHTDNLATTYDLLQVDIKLTWTSANGRPRSRELASIFGKGNIGN